MATDIFNYDGSLLTQLEDGVINTTSSTLHLVGKGWKGWGQPTQQNLLWVMQNFAGSTAPTSPVIGQLWYDSSTNANIIKVWDGTAWIASGGVVSQPTEPPTGASKGSFWYDTVNMQLQVWNGTTWDIVGPLGSKVNTDPINPAIPDNSVIDAIRVLDKADNNISHQIWRITVGGQIIALISKDAAFEPDSPILESNGFNTIYPGLNFNSTIIGNGFSGNKIIEDLLPDVNNVRNLGSSALKFANVYTNNLTIPGTLAVTGQARLGPSTITKAAAIWEPTATGQLSNPPQLGAIEFDGTSFTFVNRVGGVPTRQAPIFSQDLSNSRRLYVSSINGDDEANGSDPSKAKKTIKGALLIAEPGDTIFVESGDYYEYNPLVVPQRVSIVGDNLRRVIVHPIHDQLDIFHVDVGSYFFGMTFKGHRAPAYCFAFECSTATAVVDTSPLSPTYQKVTGLLPTYSQSGYTVAPRVSIEPPPFGGTQAEATANLVNGAVIEITISNVGAGYSTGPGQVTATVTGTTGSGAQLRVRTNLNGTIAAIDILNPGSNYTGTITVNIVDTAGSGAGAVATATVANGVIGSYTITNQGSGYSYDRVPHVSIQPITPRFITSSPYVQNCSSITGPFDINGREITKVAGTWNSPTDPGTPFAILDPEGAGAGLRIDGDVLADNTVIRSFVADSFTQINQGGIGHLIINNGYAQFVSCFTTFSSVGYWARSGGFANISNSVIDFGDIGLKSEGYYTGPGGQGYESGTLSQNYRSTVASVTLSSGGSGYAPNITFNVTFPHPSASVVATGIAYTDSTGQVTRVGDITPGTGYAAIPSINWSNGNSFPGPGGVGAIVQPVGVVNMAQNSTLVITSDNIPLTAPREPKNASGVLINNVFHTVISANEYSSTEWVIDIYPPLLAGNTGDAATFHYISNLSTGGLALEYVGSGVTYYALPYYGGVPDAEKQVQDGEDPLSLLYPGRVYYVTIDNTGNFKVGKLFGVNFADGSVSINANAFNLTGLSGIGPFKRNGAIVGTYSDEISNDPSLTHIANPTYDDTTLVTQSAVRTYLQQMSTNLLPNIDGLRTIGSTSKRWNTLYGNLNAVTASTGTLSVTGTGTLGTVNATTGGITTVNSTTINATNVYANLVDADSFTANGGSITGNFSVVGNLTVTGTQFIVNVTDYSLTDPMIDVGTTADGRPLTVDDGFERGLLINHYNNPGSGTPTGQRSGDNHSFFGICDTVGANKGSFVFVTNVAPNYNVVTSGSLHNVPMPGTAGANTVWGNISVGSATINGTLSVPNTPVSLSGLTITNSGANITGDVLIDGDLNVTGDITAFYVSPSDARLKTNITKIDNSLDKVLNLNGYNYKWNALGVEKYKRKEEESDVGVIAQELEKILPQAVHEDKDGYKTVAYDKIIPLLIEAIKDLKHEIDELKSGK